jgi:hypothetical protein
MWREAIEIVEMPKKGFISNKLRPWIEARKRYRLSHAQIQMARELGMNPKRFGSKANHKQEPWKAPLPDYIEELYEKRFGKTRPDDIRPLEVKDAEKRKRKTENKNGKSRNKNGKSSNEEAIT